MLTDGTAAAAADEEIDSVAPRARSKKKKEKATGPLSFKGDLCTWMSKIYLLLPGGIMPA